MSKRWYKSKTVWVNALTLVASVAVAMQGDTEITNPQVVSALGAVLAGVNLVLRFVTQQPVGK